MKAQKIFIEVYVEDGLDTVNWLQNELLDSDLVSFADVHMITEYETKYTYPQAPVDRLRELVDNFPDLDCLNIKCKNLVDFNLTYNKLSKIKDELCKI